MKNEKTGWCLVLGAWFRKPGTRNPEPGTRNPEPGTRNPFLHSQCFILPVYLAKSPRKRYKFQTFHTCNPYSVFSPLVPNLCYPLLSNHFFRRDLPAQCCVVYSSQPHPSRHFRLNNDCRLRLPNQPQPRKNHPSPHRSHLRPKP